MSPALNGSSEIYRSERAGAIDGIMFVFYSGLPHIRYIITLLCHCSHKHSGSSAGGLQAQYAEVHQASLVLYCLDNEKNGR